MRLPSVFVALLLALLCTPKTGNAQCANHCGSCAPFANGGAIGNWALVTFTPGMHMPGDCDGSTPCDPCETCKLNWTLVVTWAVPILHQGAKLCGQTIAPDGQISDGICVEYASVPNFPDTWVVTAENGELACGWFGKFTLRVRVQELTGWAWKNVAYVDNTCGACDDV